MRIVEKITAGLEWLVVVLTLMGLIAMLPLIGFAYLLWLAIKP